MWITDGRTLNHSVLKEMTSSSCCLKKSVHNLFTEIKNKQFSLLMVCTNILKSHKCGALKNCAREWYMYLKVYGSTRAVRNHRPCLAFFPSRVYFLNQKGWLLGHTQQRQVGSLADPDSKRPIIKARRLTVRVESGNDENLSQASLQAHLYFEYCAVGGSITSVIDYCLSAALFFFRSAQESFLFVLMMWWRVFIWSDIWWFYHMWG